MSKTTLEALNDLGAAVEQLKAAFVEAITPPCNCPKMVPVNISICGQELFIARPDDPHDLWAVQDTLRKAQNLMINRKGLEFKADKFEKINKIDWTAIYNCLSYCETDPQLFHVVVKMNKAGLTAKNLIAMGARV